jgi:DNA-binding PadR family transcriptional regulator
MRRAQRGWFVMLRSPVGWALLGLVVERPGYGHELVQRFERAYGDALPLGSSAQIYEALDSLASKSLVEEVDADRDGAAGKRQPKLRYKATKGGVSAYHEWLVSQAAEERRRSRLVTLQLAALPPRTALEIIGRYERQWLQRAHEVPDAAEPGDEEPGPDELTARLAHEEDRVAIAAKLRWISYARSQFEAIASGEGR